MRAKKLPATKAFAAAVLVSEVYKSPRPSARVNEETYLSEKIAKSTKGFTPEEKIHLAIKLESWAKELRDNVQVLQFRQSLN